MREMMEVHESGVANREPTAGRRLMYSLHNYSCYNSFSPSPCINSIAWLEGMLSPEVKCIIHWMVVPLYSTGILMKFKCPKILFSVLIPSVWLRSSSRVPFTNHWNCSITSNIDEYLHVKVVFPPGTTTLSG